MSDDELEASPEGSPIPPDETATGVLESVREESRDVLDHRIDLLQATDDKLARTVRTAMLVSSIVISALSVGGLEVVAGISDTSLALGGIGIVGLFATVTYGIVAYSDAELTLGPDQRFRREPRSEPYSEREWLILLTVGYDEWVSDLKRVNESKASQLWRIQLLLVASLFALLTAIGLSLWPV